MTARRNKPNPIDEWFGRQIRLRRRRLGLSQEALARRIGVSPAQMHKFESGKDRVSISRLYDICEALDVVPGMLLSGLPQPIRYHSPARQARARHSRRARPQPEPTGAPAPC